MKVMFKLPLLVLAVLFSVFSSPCRAELTVYTSEVVPANYTSDSEIVGTSVDIVRELLKMIGSDAQIVMQPWARAFETALDRKDVMLFTAGKTPEREQQGFHFIGPIMTRRHAVYRTRGAYAYVSSIEDIIKNRLTVGGMREDWRVKFLKEAGVQMEAVSLHKQNLFKVRNKRIHFFVLSDIEIFPLTAKVGMPSDAFEEAVLIKEAPSYLMLSPGTDPALVKALGAAFVRLQQTDFCDGVARKYTDLLGYELVYSRKKGIHLKFDDRVAKAEHSVGLLQ